MKERNVFLRIPYRKKIINKQCDFGSLDFSEQEMNTLEDTKVLKY